MALQNATVTTIQGQVWARSADGTQRLLQVGDTVAADEVLVTASWSVAGITFANGQVVFLSGNLSIVMDPSLYPGLVEGAGTVEGEVPEVVSGEGAVSSDNDAQGGTPLSGSGETAAPDSSTTDSEGMTYPFQLRRVGEELRISPFQVDRVREDTVGDGPDTGGLSFGENIDPDPDPGPGPDPVVPNFPPEAEDQYLVTDEDIALSGIIPASDPYSDPLRYSVIVEPEHGTVILDPVTGAFTYTPDPNYHGEDSFQVEVTDFVYTDTETTYITVLPVNDPATITGNAQGALTEDASDPDLTVSGQLAVSDLDEGEAVFSTTVSAQGAVLGSLFITGQGNWQYTVANADVQYLQSGEQRIEQFVVSSIDGSATVNVVITITGTNDVPGITVTTDDSDAASLIESDAPLTTGGTLSVADIDLLDSISATIDGVSASISYSGSSLPDYATLLSMLQLGSAVVIPAGQQNGTINWLFNSDPQTFDFLPDGETLTLEYTISVDDGHGGEDSQSVLITISGSNDRPDITAGNLGFGNEDEADPTITVTGQLQGVDRDDGETAVLDDVGTIAPIGGALGSLVITATGAWTYTVANAAVQYLAEGEIRVERFQFLAFDGTPFVLTVTLTGTNDAPVISVETGDSDAETLTESNAALSVSGTLTLGDVDVLDSVNVAVTSVSTSGDTNGISLPVLRSMMSLGANPVLDSGETTDLIAWTFNSNTQTFDHLADGESLVLTYTLTANDGLATDTHTVSITITGTNDVPDITVETGDSATETLDETNAGLSASGTLSVFDSDITNTVDASVDSLSVTGNDNGVGNTALLAMLTVGANPIIANGVTSGTINWIFNSGTEAFDYLAVGESLVLEYTLIADDGTAQDSQTVTITINGTNDAPVISVEGGDSDAESLTETDVALTTSGTLSVSDVDVLDTVTTSVTGVTTNNYASASVPDNATLLSMLSVDAGAVIDSADTTGTINWSFDSNPEAFDFLPDGETLNLVYTVQVSDGNGGTDTHEVTLSIMGTNDLPVVTGGDAGAATEDSDDPVITVTGQLTGGDPDDGETFTQTTVTPQGSPLGSLTIDTLGAWTYTVANAATQYLAVGETRDEQFQILTADGTAHIITVTLTGTNDTPVITVDAGDSDAESATETDTGLTASGTLSVDDVDVLDEVSSSVTSVSAGGTYSGSSTPANATLLAMLGVDAGTVIDDASTTGTINWVFDSGSEAFDFLADGVTLILTYTVEVSDGNGGTDTHDVVITLTGTNDVPLITGDDTGSVTEDDSNPNLTTSGTLSAGDVDDGESLFSTTVVPDANAIGSLSITQDGDWSYTLDNALVQYLAEGESFTETFTVSTIDGSASQDIVITVNGTNDEPEIVIDIGMRDAVNVAETDAPIVGFATVRVNDVDTLDIVNPSIDAVSYFGDAGSLSNADLLAMLTIEAGDFIDGSSTTAEVQFNFDSGTETFDYLEAASVLDLFYAVSVDDGEGGYDSYTINVRIIGTNDSPEITIEAGDSAAAAIDETNGALSASGTLSVADLDVQDIVAVSLGGVTAFDSYGSAQVPANAALLAMFSVGTNPVIVAGSTTGQIDWVFDSNTEAFDFLPDGETLTLTYTVVVQDNHAGNDNFGESRQDTIDVVITITGTNDVPVITGGNTGAAFEDSNDPTITITGQLTGADPDEDETWTISGAGSSSGPTLGSLNMGDAGDWQYQVANADIQYLAESETLDEVFNITAADGTSIDITVTLTGVNDDPVISVQGSDSDAEGVTETNATLTTSGTLTVDDVDILDEITVAVDSLAVTGDDNGIGNAALLSMLSADAGAVINNSTDTGSINWTFDSDGEAFDYLQVGQALQLVYTLATSDNHGATDSHDVTITITGSNDAPVLSVESGDSDAAGLDETDAPLSTTGTLTTTDIDVLDAVTTGISSTVGVNGNAGTLIEADFLAMFSVNPATIIASGVTSGVLDWTFDSGSEVFDFLVAGSDLVLQYTVEVDDSNGGTDTHVVTITITGANDGAAISGTATGAVTEDDASSLTATGGLSVSDIDTGEAIFSTTVTPVGTVLGGLTIDSAGNWSYTLDNSLVQYLQAGETRDEVFAVTSIDGSASQNITITVTGVNDDPLIQVDGDDSDSANLIETNSDLGTDGTLSVTDIDVRDEIQSFVSGVTESGNTGAHTTQEFLDMMSVDGGAIVGSTATEGDFNWYFSSNPHAFDYLPVGDTLTLVYTLGVDDGNGGTDTHDVTIVITGTNDIPIAFDDSVTTGENQLYSGTTPAGFDIDGTISSYTTAGGTTTPLGTVTFNSADHSYTFDPGTDFDYLAEGSTVDVSFTYRTQDNEDALSDFGTITITVVGEDDPANVSNGSGTVKEDVTLVSSGTLSVTDIDNDNIGFVVSSQNGLYGIFVSDVDGNWTYTLDNDLPVINQLNVGDSLQEVFTVTATDPASSTGTVTITIQGTNDAPAAPDLTFTIDLESDTVLNEDVVFTDVDGTIASYGLVSDVSEGGLVFDVVTGSFVFTPGTDFDDLAQGETRDVSFTYRAADNNGAPGAIGTVTITVIGVDDDPVIGLGSGTVVEAPGAPVTASGTISAVDADNPALAFVPVSGDTSDGYGSFSIDAAGNWTYNLDAAASDSLDDGDAPSASVFTVNLTDGSSTTVTINITGTNDAPVAFDDAVTTDENTPVSGTLPVPADVDASSSVAGYVLVSPVPSEEGLLTFNASNGEWTFNPSIFYNNLNDGGSETTSFQYQVVDDQGAFSNTATVTITITGITDPADNDYSYGFEVNDGSDIVITGGADSDLTPGVYIPDSPDETSGAILVVNPDGTWQFTYPDTSPVIELDPGGGISFTFTVPDQSNPGNDKTVTIDVFGVNDLPEAQDDTASTDQNTILNDQVPAATDDDPAGSIAGYVLDSGPTPDMGSLAFNQSTGAWSFDPGDDFDYLDDGESTDITFTYHAIDNNGEAGPEATVTITINGVDDPVVVDTDTGYASAEDGQETDSGTLNSYDPDANDPQPEYVVTTYSGTYGTLSIDSTSGDWSYTLDVNDPDYQALAPGVTADDVFSNVAMTIGGPSAVTVTVEGYNTPPVASDVQLDIDEDTVLNGDLFPETSDADGTVITLVLIDDVAQGTLLFNANGSFAFDPTGQFDYLQVGESEDVTFTYRAQDNGGAISDLATVTITVEGVDDPAVISAPNVNLKEDANITASGTLGVTDVDNDVAASGFEPVDTDGTYGHLTVDANGNWSYTLDDALTDPLQVGDNVQDQFTINLTGELAGESTTITLHIAGTNDPPEVGGQEAFTIDEDSALSDSVLATDVDGVVVTYTLAGGGGLNGDPGTLDLNANGTFTYDPGDNFQYLSDGEEAIVTFTYRAQDNSDAISDPITVTVTIHGVNDLPTSTAIPDQDDAEADAISLDVSGYFDDIDTSNTFEYAATGLPDGLTIDLNTGVISGTLSSDASASSPFTVTITATDDGGETTQQSFEWTVSNPSPVFDEDSYSFSEDEGALASTSLGSVSATDPDSDDLSYSITAGNDSGLFAIDANTGEITLTQEVDDPQVGSYSLTVQVEDTDGATDTVTVNIVLNNINEAPVPADNSITVDEESIDTPLGLSAPTDPDGNTLTITITGLPTLGTVTLANGTAVTNGQVLSESELTGLQYDAPGEYNGTDPVGVFTYTVDDGQGDPFSVQTGTVTITVNAVNDAPVVTDTSITVDEESADTPLGITAPTDPDGDGLTITVTGLPILGMVTLANGTAVTNGQELSESELTGLQYDAPDEYNSTDPVGAFTYSVDDGQGEGNSVQTGTVIITVNAVNDVPVVTDTSITVDEESENTPLTIAAPTDDDGDDLTITVTGLPLLGIITLASGAALANGQTLSIAELTGLQYDAPDDYNGSDDPGSFIYSVDDGQETVTGTVTITINAINDVPVANNDTATAQENTLLENIDVLANDTDADGDSLIVTGAAANNGFVTVNPDYTLNYQPDAGFTGSDSITYLVSDGNGGSTLGIVEVTVEAVDQVLTGTSGDDVLEGASGNDSIAGGSGEDNLTGGAGADTFIWNSGDEGIPGVAVTDTITDFSTADADSLDLSDLLDAADSGTIQNYLNFTDDGTDTTINVSSSGGYSGGFDAGQTDQIIMLQGIVLAGSNNTELNDLVNSGSLVIA